MNMTMRKYVVECLGTAALVLIGCGAVAVGGLGAALGSDSPLGAVALLPIGAAFGLAVTAMAYGIGPISGCHINPAVSIGAWAAGRLPSSELVGYIVAQVIGGIIGAAILYIIVSGKNGGYNVATSGLGATTWSDNVSVVSAFIIEFVVTFLFVTVILGATSKAGMTPVAGLAIGLTLMILHVAFAKATGISANPARSIGPAIFVGARSLSDLWLYIIAPPLGGYVAGLLFKAKILEAE